MLSLLVVQGGGLTAGETVFFGTRGENASRRVNPGSYFRCRIPVFVSAVRVVKEQVVSGRPWP